MPSVDSYAVHLGQTPGVPAGQISRELGRVVTAPNRSLPPVDGS